MTDLERLAVKALSGVTFLPGHPHKRFARDMAAKAADYQLSARQSAWLWFLVVRYRRQINPKVVEIARRFVEPSKGRLDFGKPRFGDPAQIAASKRRSARGQ